MDGHQEDFPTPLTSPLERRKTRKDEDNHEEVDEDEEKTETEEGQIGAQTSLLAPSALHPSLLAQRKRLHKFMQPLLHRTLNKNGKRKMLGQVPNLSMVKLDYSIKILTVKQISVTN